MNIKNFVWVVLLFLIVTGCKTRKQAVVEAPPENKRLAQVDSVFESMKQSEYQFNTFIARFSGIYNYDGSRQNFSGQIRIKKDSLIWCSISVMNIEVARVYVTPDSVKMLNKLNKTCYISDIEFINKQLNTDIDFDMLQALILGNDIPYYETDKFQLENRPESFILNTIGRRKLKKYVENEADIDKVLIQKMKIDKATYKIIEQDLKQLRNPNKKVEAFYEEFEDYGGLFPTKMEFKFVGVKELVVNFKFSRIEKNIDLDFPFRVPSSYTIQ